MGDYLIWGSGQDAFSTSRVEPSRVTRCSKFHGSGQDGFDYHGSD